MLQYTAEQERIFSAIFDQRNDCLVDCQPGSGKTFLVNEAANKLVSNGNTVLPLSFSNIGVSQFNIPGALTWTTTKLGYSVVTNYYWSKQNNKRTKYYKPNDKFDKYTYLTRYILKTEGYEKKEIFSIMQSGLRQLVDFARNYLAESLEDYKYIWSIFNPSTEFPIEYMQLTELILEEGISRFEKNCSMDYIDCIWLPNKIDMELSGFRYYVTKGQEKNYSNFRLQKSKNATYIDFPEPDEITIFLDEYQDCTKTELFFLKQFVDDGARIILVGDQQQAIYLFRCSMNNATEIANNIFDDLSHYEIVTSFRCPQSHTRFMRERIISTNGISPRPLSEKIQSFNDDEGEILECDLRNIVDYIVPGKTAIIGRNFNGKNSDIIPALVEILNHSDYTIRVEGVSLNNGYVKRVLATMQENKTDRIAAREIIIFEEEQKMSEDDNYFVNLNDLRDELDFAVLVIGLCAGCETVQEITSFLEEYFDNPNPDIVFSTIHRVKGATYENVIVLNANKWPYFDERNSIDVNLQEINLMLVAFSRSNNRMVLCNYPTNL